MSAADRVVLPTGPASSRLQGAGAISVLLFAVALATRLWGLSFGLPNYFSGDEVAKRDAALALAQSGAVYEAPQPAFLYRSLALVYRVADLLPVRLDEADYLLLARLWMAVLGSLTVVVIWHLGSQTATYQPRRTATVAALLLAVLPLHTTVSRYVKEDAPLGLAASLVVLAAVSYCARPTRARLLLTGAAMGFACSTKFTGAILAVPVTAAIWLAASGQRMSLIGFARQALLCAGAAALTFFAISPNFLVEPAHLFSAIAYQAGYARTGHDGIAIGPWTEWWTYYVRQGLIPGMTPPVLIAALTGFGLLRRTRVGAILITAMVSLYLVLEQSPAKPVPFAARYLMPLVPLLCVSAAATIVQLLRVIEKRMSTRIAWALTSVACLGPPAVRSTQITDEALHDTRIIAGAWMDDHLPAGTRIVVAEDRTTLPVSSRWDGDWLVEDWTDRAGAHALLDRTTAPYVVVSSFRYQRYLDYPDAVPERTRFYRSLMADYALVREFRPRWLTYGKHSPVIRVYRFRT